MQKTWVYCNSKFELIVLFEIFIIPYMLNFKMHLTFWVTIYYFKSYKRQVKAYLNPRRTQLFRTLKMGEKVRLGVEHIQ